MSALVRITTGIMPQHSRVGMSRAMAQFGEVIHCHKPPYSGIAGEDFVNVRFANQGAADAAYAALKANQVFVDGFQVGVGPTPSGGGGGKGDGGGGKGGGKGKDRPPALEYHHNGRRRSQSPPRHFARNRQRSPFMNRRGGGGGRSPRRGSPLRANFPSRGDPKSPSPRRWAREMHMTTKEQQDRMRSRSRSRSRSPPPMARGPPPRRYQERGSEFSGGNMAIAGMPTSRARTARTPSPDPPGPAKNMAQVKNPFYRSGSRSPSPASSHRSMGYGQAVEAN